VKMYRRLEAGLNPELEMLLFLTEHDFAHSPQAAGWYSYSGTQLRDARHLPGSCPTRTAGRSGSTMQRTRRVPGRVAPRHDRRRCTAPGGRLGDPAFPEEPTPETLACSPPRSRSRSTRPTQCFPTTTRSPASSEGRRSCGRSPASSRPLRWVAT
jgi:hypothetical protein